ncbi:MAG: helix-turn-helix domain-containing protein, partial [Chloroflexota bacterium]
TIEYASLVELALGYQVDPLEAKELIKRHIFTLRQKIGPDFSTPRYILNVRGYGYRLDTGETLESVITG